MAQYWCTRKLAKALTARAGAVAARQQAPCGPTRFQYFIFLQHQNSLGYALVDACARGQQFTRFSTFYTFNPACGGVFFTVELIIAKIIIFRDLNRSAVALALGHARAMAISMARGGDGKRT